MPTTLVVLLGLTTDLGLAIRAHADPGGVKDIHVQALLGMGSDTAVQPTT